MTYQLKICMFLSMTVSGMCIEQSTTVNLTASFSLDQLKLECYVSNLQLPVDIKRNNTERGHCTNIYPSSKCYAYESNETLTQNLTTNITTFTATVSNPDLFNGRWNCCYGQLNSSVFLSISFFVNVSYRSDDKTPQMNDDEIPPTNDDVQSYAYVYISQLAAFCVFFIITQTYVQRSSQQGERVQILIASNSFLDGCTNGVNRITQKYVRKKHVHLALKIVFCGVLSFLLIFTPLIFDKLTREKYIAIIESAISGTFLGFLFALLVHTEKDSREHRESLSDHDPDTAGGNADAAGTVVHIVNESDGEVDNNAESLPNEPLVSTPLETTGLTNSHSTEHRKSVSNRDPADEGSEAGALTYVHNVHKMYDAVTYKDNRGGGVDNNAEFLPNEPLVPTPLKTTNLTNLRASTPGINCIQLTFDASLFAFYKGSNLTTRKVAVPEMMRLCNYPNRYITLRQLTISTFLSGLPLGLCNICKP